jgi:hypothetical protein
MTTTTTTPTNIVADAVALVASRLGALSDGERAAFEREMDVSAEEHFRFQQAQAQAHAGGYLSTDEAMIVYAALGEYGSSRNGGWAAGTDLATKVAVTLMMPSLVVGRRPRPAVAS